MKDPLVEYLENNREELDTYVPEKENWDIIRDRIHKKKKRKRLVIWSSVSVAASLAIFFMIRRDLEQLAPDTRTHMAQERDFSSRQHQVDLQIEAEYDQQEGKAMPNSATSELQISDGYVLYSVSDNVSSSMTSNGVAGNLQFKDNHEYRFDRVESEADYDIAPVPTPEYDVDYYYEQYDDFNENAFESPFESPLSTFGIDVDGAAYSNVRRFINQRFLPPKNAVKLEEMINYFQYDLPEPKGDHPFSITTELGECPWQSENLLMQVAIKGKKIDMNDRKPSNLVFLLDVSGSMEESDKLPLLKKSMKLLVNEMNEDDRIAIVVYAGAAGLVLPSTSGANKSRINEAIDQLAAGGSTAGGQGIELAYAIAEKEFRKYGNNRIVLATDGDFNVGISNDNDLVDLISAKRRTGVFLSVLGFGTGNLQSSKMEKLADHGNGNYFYIDNLMEAKKVLVHEMGGTLYTIAKDVKLQLEFNPEHVKNYRLLGYENRLLADRDFADDTKDAGDLGSGHTIVAMYEIVPQQERRKVQSASNLRYSKDHSDRSKGLKDELAVIKFRYKQPDGHKSKLIKKVVSNNVGTASANFKQAAAVAEFGMLIRESRHRGEASFAQVLELAQSAKGKDPKGYRQEFIRLVKEAELLMNEYCTKTARR